MTSAIEPETPLAGRRLEVRRLLRAFEDAVDERSCRVLTVRAEPGIGKTRLALELASRVEGDARVLFTHCPSYGEGVPLWPLTDLIGQLPPPEDVVGGPDGALVRERLTKGRMDECFLAVRTVLERLAARCPLVVVVEDAQWAQPTFLELVDHLARRIRDAPILVLGLARAGSGEPLQAGSGATAIRLEPLSRADSEELLDAQPAAARIAPDVRARIALAAQGNPLFLEQAAALLAGDEVPSVPSTLAELVAARVARLPARTRAIAECAAVEGLVFHARAVAETAPAELAGETPADLEALVDAQLARSWPATLAGEDGFRFRHLAIRDAIYAATAESTRGALHERYAAWRERAVPRGHDDDGILAYHVERAHDALAPPAPAARRATLARRAAEHLVAGGLRAYSRVDRSGDAAPKLLARASALLADDDPLRREILPTLAAACGDGADGDAGAAAIREGRSLAAALDDRRLAARLAVEDGWLRFHVDPDTELAAALADVEESLPVLEELGDDAGLARGLYAHGTLLFSIGRAGPALDPLQRSVAHARKAGDHRLEVDAIWQLEGPMYWGPMPVEEALALSSELREQLPPGSQADAFTVVLEAVFLAMLGRFDEARKRRATGEAMYDELGLVGADVGVPQYSSRLDLLAGDVDMAASQLQEACDAYERRGETGYLTSTAAMLGEVLYRQGLDEEAFRATETAARTAAPDDFSAQMLWRSVRGKIVARRGDHDGAERLAREAVALGEGSDYLFMRADSLLDLADVLLMAARPDDAAESARAALALYERKGELVSVDRARALVSDAAAPSGALA